MSLRPRSTLLLFDDVHFLILSSKKVPKNFLIETRTEIFEQSWFSFSLIKAVKYNKIKVSGVNCYMNDQYK